MKKQHGICLLTNAATSLRAVLLFFGRQMSGPRGALTSLLAPPRASPHPAHGPGAPLHLSLGPPALSHGQTLDPHRSPSPALSLLPSTFGADGTPVMAVGPGSWLAGPGGCR